MSAVFITIVSHAGMFKNLCIELRSHSFFPSIRTQIKATLKFYWFKMHTTFLDVFSLVIDILK